MTILREGKKSVKEANTTIRKTDSGSEKITWKDFINHYNKEKIILAQFFPYAYTNKSGCKSFIGITGAIIEVASYNTLWIHNQTTEISLAASEITSISEEWMYNAAEVHIWTKAKGHLVIKIR